MTEPIKLSEVEEGYVDRALQNAVPMLEIAYVLLLWRITTQLPDITDPDLIQRQFTIIKGEVQRVFRQGGSAMVPGVYIPKSAREKE